jgi:hypothetical protein
MTCSIRLHGIGRHLAGGHQRLDGREAALAALDD